VGIYPDERLILAIIAALIGAAAGKKFPRLGAYPTPDEAPSGCL
jgi:hypothetical protein